MRVGIFSIYTEPQSHYYNIQAATPTEARAQAVRIFTNRYPHTKITSVLVD